MANIKIIAVPNGFFTLNEVIDSSPMQEAITQLKADKSLSQEDKLKSLLIVYQTLDTLAQLKIQGIEDVNVDHISTASSIAINAAFEQVMETFSDEDQAELHSLFQHRYH